MDWLMSWFMPLVLVLIVLLVILGVPLAIYLLYASSQSPTFSLRKDEWACSASVERSSTVYVQSGNVMVPLTTHYKHCTQWSEKP